MSENLCPACGHPLDPRSTYCVNCERLLKERDKHLHEQIANTPATRVIVTNINMPFWSMVGFMVKAAIAAIPAMIILTIIFGLITTIVGSFFYM